MRSTSFSSSRPALLPALAFLFGGALPVALPIVSLPLLASLGGLGVALGGECGTLVAFFGAGALNAAVRWVLPQRALPPLDTERPVEAVATVVGHPTRSAFGWTQPVRVRTLRQGPELAEFLDDVVLSLPETVSPPEPGAVVRAVGYLKRSPGFANVPPTSPAAWRLTVKTQALLRSERAPPRWLEPSNAVRRRLDLALRRAGIDDNPGIALAAALLVGDTSAIPDALRRDLRRTGLLHLLAVSGFNVSLLLLAVWLCAYRLRLRLRVVIAGSAVGLFVLVVGPLPSVLRAGVMGALLLGALVLRRPPVVGNAVAVAGLVLALVDPSLPADLGFQLTFAATAGLVFLSPILSRAWSGLPAFLAAPVAATWAAQMATLPWALLAFHQLQPAAFLFNLAFVPLAGCAMLLDLAWAAIGCANPTWGAALAWLPNAIAAPFGWLGRISPGPWLSVPVAARTALPIAAALVLLTWASCRRRLLLLAVTLALAVGAAALRGRAPGPVQACFLDVGQGDGALLRDGDQALLIDGGGFAHGDFGGTVLWPVLAEAGVHSLHAMVMTHGDADHCRGLVDLADDLPVDEVWLARSQADSPCGRELLGRRRLKPRYLTEGAHLALGRWRFDVLGPGANTPPGARASDNDGSIVLRAAVAGRVFLFTGDIERAAELRLVRVYGDGLRATVLKAPHHGSKSSSGAEFLDRVAPRIAVVSAGIGNRFGHPHPEVVGRYQARGVRILRTDRDGEIVFRLLADGPHWGVDLPATPR